MFIWPFYFAVMDDQEDDVLSLSAHGECISGGDTDVSIDEFVVVDEVGPDDDTVH